MRPTPAAALCAAVLLALACAAKEAESPGAEVASTRPSPDVPAGASGWNMAGAGLPAQRASARAKVGEALRQLDVAGNACGDACPADVTLRSAVKELCGITESKDDDIACKEAKATLVSLEAALLKTCEGCKPPKPESDDAGGALGY
jgi:hypothetical protein